MRKKSFLHRLNYNFQQQVFLKGLIVKTH